MPIASLPMTPVIESGRGRYAPMPQSITIPRAIKMKAGLLQFLRDSRGITAIEYGLIAGVLALGIMTAVGDVAGQLSSTFEAITKELSSVKAPGSST
jgi:pilus assembly protein Flp/PilA